MTPAILRHVADMQAVARGWKAAGRTVGVVPTMGALHAGHLSLARAAKAGCDRVIVTIFVNPRQFNTSSDLLKYPRTEGSDAAMLATVGVDMIFAPEADAVYPPGFATNISVGGVSGPLEGVHRPGHFDGVATVVAKLFCMTLADCAYFGEKDWQQLQVVRRLVRDLNLPVAIVGCETVREADGLALSSRNARLSVAARAQAPALHRALLSASGALRAGVPAAAAIQGAVDEVLASGFAAVDYIELRSVDLEPMERLDGAARLLAAATLDGVRLTDNIAV